jgi:hypothetical protein
VSTVGDRWKARFGADRGFSDAAVLSDALAVQREKMRAGDGDAGVSAVRISARLSTRYEHLVTLHDAVARAGFTRIGLRFIEE